MGDCSFISLKAKLKVLNYATNNRTKYTLKSVLATNNLGETQETNVIF
jgi:hypothetical protein